MSEDVIAILITLAIIALFFAWMPLLNFICSPCGRFLEQRRLQNEAAKSELLWVQSGTKRPSSKRQ
jgi:hypothetical protein